jgi:prepilin-type N-terminal cleavage/methylation domain-containing protein
MNRKYSGSTLIEVMVSLVIFSIGVLGVCQLQQSTMYQMNDLFYRSRALELASSQLEIFRSHGSQAVSPLQLSLPDSLTAFERSEQLTLSGKKILSQQPIHFSDIRSTSDCESEPPYCVFISVSNDLFHGDLKVIQAKVIWPDKWGKTHAVTLSTMISRFNEFESYRSVMTVGQTDIGHGTGGES